MRQDFLRQETDITRELVNFEQAGISNRQITRLILDEWRGSEAIKDMQTAREYYLVRNVAIQGKSRSYTDAAGARHENPLLSNVKIPSAFLRTAVNQKANYAFGKPFTISVENASLDEEAQRNDETGKMYLAEWQAFVDMRVRKTIKRLGASAINKGIAWAYVWIGEDGMLQLVDADSETIYPQWTDRAHTSLDALVRDYMMVMYEGENPVEVYRVEYWDGETVERYIDKDGELIDDAIPIEGQPDMGNGHQRRPLLEQRRDPETVGLTETGAIVGYEEISWGRAPFIALKGSEDELPLLKTVKDRIDAYDTLASKGVDSLVDDIDPLLVIENMSPEIGGLIRAREIMKNTRIMSTDTGGRVYYVQVNPNLTALQMELEGLRKDIREFSTSVDTQDVKFGSNPSGVALKAMYQDLDIYTDGLETEFEMFIENLKYFFDRWLEFRGIGTVEQWAEYKVIVALNRDMLINEGELIDQTVKLSGTGVSQETIDNYNPAVESFEVEQARRLAQIEEEMERQRELAAFLEKTDMFEKTQGAAGEGEEGDDGDKKVTAERA